MKVQITADRYNQQIVWYVFKKRKKGLVESVYILILVENVVTCESGAVVKNAAWYFFVFLSRYVNNVTHRLLTVVK